METSVLLKTLTTAIEVEENIALRMLLLYSKEAIQRMSTSLEGTADALSNTPKEKAIRLIREGKGEEAIKVLEENE